MFNRSSPLDEGHEGTRQAELKRIDGYEKINTWQFGGIRKCI